MKAYKYRIYPNKAQKVLIKQHFDCARFVYNWGLGLKNKYYEDNKKSLSKRALQDCLVAAKRTDKPWLKEVNSQSLLASLGNLDLAFKNFFRQQNKYPTFKSKHAGWKSFQCPQHSTVDFESNQLSLTKIPGIKAKFHRPFEGEIKTVTIKQAPSGKYFASVLVKDRETLPLPSTIELDKTLGLDVGLNHFIIDSEDNKTENPRFLRKALNRLAIEQKKLARKKKGSNNRSKQKLKVAIVHEKISNKRHHFIHEETARLVNENQATSFAVEDLNIKGMAKNKKLAKSIHDASWGTFITVLGYKCLNQGKNLLKIGRFEPSSKRCNHCHHIMGKLPLSVREWQCPSCLEKLDRDVNAAKNIRDMSLADAVGHKGLLPIV